MAGRNQPGSSDRSLRAAVGAAIAAVLLLGPATAAADGGRPRQVAHVVSAQASSQPAEPDVFERIARWLDDTFGGINQGLKQTFGQAEQAGERTRAALKDVADGVSESAESLASLPNIRIVSKRQRCEPAANGAPDCRRAAEAACRSQGFASGRSLETQSERVCNAPRLFAQASQPACRNETVVLRAICQ